MTRPRRSIVVTVSGALAVAGVLAWALAGRRDEFAAALDAAPFWILLLAAVLQIVALVSRSEAWHVSVAAAGGTVSRRRLHRAAGVGNLVLGTGPEAGAPRCYGARRRSMRPACRR